MGIKSFRDPVTNRLKAFGYMASNSSGDIAQDEPDGFNLDLLTHAWVWDGSAWNQVPQVTLDAEAQQTARTGAESKLAGINQASPVVLRAIAFTLLDELNILREWTVSFKTAVASATSLANLQSRVAALPTLDDRTPLQARNAIVAKIDSGDADA